MKLYNTVGYNPLVFLAGYLIHDSDSAQQVVLASPMPADSNGLMESRIWKRDVWERPHQSYVDGSWVIDSNLGDSNVITSSRYFWVSRIPEFRNNFVYDSYNFVDSTTSAFFVCRLDSASAETGISNMWKPSTFNFFMIRRPGDTTFEVDSDVRVAFSDWANLDSQLEEPLSIDSALRDGIKTVAGTFSSRAFVNDSLQSAIDSAVAAGSWNDSEIQEMSLNRLGGDYDTLFNVNLAANLRRSGGFTIDSYPFTQYTFDHDKDSSEQFWAKGPTSLGGIPDFYIRLEDSIFDPTDIETY